MKDFREFFNGLFYGVLVFIGFRLHAVLDAMLAEDNGAVITNLLLLIMLVISLAVVSSYRHKAGDE